MSQHDAVRDYCRERGYSSNVVLGGIPYLMRGWEQAIEWLEAEKRQVKEEYLDDLDGRQILAEVLPLATDEERRSIEDQLAKLDERFRSSTVPTRECVWGEVNARKHGWTAEREWWYFRKPAKNILE